MTKHASKKFLSVAILLFLWGWLLFCASTTLLVGHRLWWQRDRVEYAGKTHIEQWGRVLERAGLPLSLLAHAESIAADTGLNERYSLDVDPNSASVMHYLLAPRQPTSKQRAVRHESVGDGIHWGVSRYPVAGLLGSILAVFGSSYLLRHLSRHYGSLSIPESTALALLELCVLTVLLKAMLQETSLGFICFAVQGAIGCCLFCANSIKGRYSDFGYNVALGGFGWAALLCALLGGGVTILMACVVVPDDWDAWAIWGAKAKYLALGHGPLAGATAYGHADYPLLWPSLWAFTGWCGGGWEDRLAKGWSGILLLLAAWQVGLSVFSVTKVKNWGVLAGIVMLSAPKAIVVASWGYAESALWLFTACIAGRMIKRVSAFDALIAGLLCAGALMTKNDAILIVISVLIGTLSLSRIWKHSLLFSVPIVIVYCPWLIWVRYSLGLSSHATAGLSLSPNRLIFALHRAPEALKHILHIWADWQQWGGVMVLLGLLLVVALVEDRSLFRGWLVAPLYIAGMFTLVLFHTANLGWQIGASWDRFTLQAIPLVLVTTCPFIAKLIHRSLRGERRSVKHTASE